MHVYAGNVSRVFLILFFFLTKCILICIYFNKLILKECERSICIWKLRKKNVRHVLNHIYKRKRRRRREREKKEKEIRNKKRGNFFFFFFFILLKKLIFI